MRRSLENSHDRPWSTRYLNCLKSTNNGTCGVLSPHQTNIVLPQLDFLAPRLYTYINFGRVVDLIKSTVFEFESIGVIDTASYTR
ncbi:hypothetical protein Syun_019901 [Stephania yunnanensis]|uniref:Uncharacterized protein n=1 Tax=Stephania yunnanensis TaxID=152371 RepID=A0AAP0IV23_9MAGN